MHEQIEFLKESVFEVAVIAFNAKLSFVLLVCFLLSVGVLTMRKGIY